MTPPMTHPDDAGLLALLRKVESGVQCGPGSPDFGGRTNWYRNPEGPQAADRIEDLKGEVGRLETERIEAWGALEKIAAMSPNRAIAHLKEAVRMVRAARSLSRPVGEEGE